MRLLLIESTPGNATEIGAHLAADGHEVVTCTDDHGGPCRGATHHVACPMEQHIDLTIVAREAGSVRTLAEMGSVCATRHRVPLMEVDPGQEGLPSVAVAQAVAGRAVAAGYATAIRHELAHLPALVDVHRSPDQIQVTVDPCDPTLADLHVRWVVSADEIDAARQGRRFNCPAEWAGVAAGC